jgi:preprotein translocase subunit SecD
MARKTLKRFAVAILIGFSFWAGTAFQNARYTDKCLDLGGGRNPDGHSICVVEQQNAALWLGPIRVTENEIEELEFQSDSAEPSQMHLTLKPEIASQLSVFTEKSIGQDLDIWFGGDVVSSVKIVEAVQGSSIVVVLPGPVLETLAKQFNEVQ